MKLKISNMFQSFGSHVRLSCWGQPGGGGRVECQHLRSEQAGEKRVLRRAEWGTGGSVVKGRESSKKKEWSGVIYVGGDLKGFQTEQSYELDLLSVAFLESCFLPECSSLQPGAASVPCDSALRVHLTLSFVSADLLSQLLPSPSMHWQQATAVPTAPTTRQVPGQCFTSVSPPDPHGSLEEVCSPSSGI